mmetsp:Transcript_24227/g.72321  ORF Transcript_24227/g.72321 Transcript_24227/m.72321 type:complete len:626 (+) Transcript_24227:66-1943(+)
MGFDTCLVLSPKEHTSEFICPICVNLIDYESATILACSHVFCKACVSEWFDGPTNARACPVCKASVFGDGSTAAASRAFGEPLRTANPLAFRVLGHVRVRCPLWEQGCKWEGDFSEVNGHLTSSSAHTAESVAKAARSTGRSAAGAAAASSVEATALAIKDQANAQFQARNFEGALKLYTKAISVAPKLSVLSLNRAAAFLMLGRYTECISDCERVIAAEPLKAKAYLRLSSAHVHLGELPQAIAALSSGISMVQGPPPAYGAPPPHFDASRAADLELLRKELEKVEGIRSLWAAGLDQLQAGAYGDASRLFSEVLTHTEPPEVQLLAARAQLGLGVVDWATRLTLQILRRDSRNAAAYAVRAEAIFLVGELDDALKLVKQAVKLNPDDAYAKSIFRRLKVFLSAMKDAKAASERRDFETVVARYSELVDHKLPDKAPLHATLYAERANGLYRLERHDEALADCAKAIYARDDCRKAWLTKRLALNALGRHDEALREMQTLMQGWGQSDVTVRHAYQQAEFELRKSKRPDYYEIIGCGRVATEREIKTRYRARTMDLHPDKHPPESRAKAEADFKLLGEALEVLGDPMKRQLYDEGYDKSAIDERVQAAHRAARSNDSRGGHHHH